MIVNRLRGAEAPLFHRSVCIREFFGSRSLCIREFFGSRCVWIREFFGSLLGVVDFRCQIPMQNVDLFPVGPYPPTPGILESRL